MPYRLAFESEAHDGYYICAVAYEMVLVLDVLLNFRTAFPDSDTGELRVISDSHFAVQLNHFIPGFRSYLVAVCLK